MSSRLIPTRQVQVRAGLAGLGAASGFEIRTADGGVLPAHGNDSQIVVGDTTVQGSTRANDDFEVPARLIEALEAHVEPSGVEIRGSALGVESERPHQAALRIHEIVSP